MVVCRLGLFFEDNGCFARLQKCENEGLPSWMEWLRGDTFFLQQIRTHYSCELKRRNWEKSECTTLVVTLGCAGVGAWWGVAGGGLGVFLGGPGGRSTSELRSCDLACLFE